MKINKIRFFGKNIALIFLLCSFLFLGVFVNATFDSGSLGTFGSTSHEAGNSDSQSLTLTNNYVNHSLSDFSYDFSISSDFSNSLVDENDFVISFPNNITNGNSNNSVGITFTLPINLDAIDNNFSSVVSNLGTLNITANATNITEINTSLEQENFITYDTLTVNAEVSNELKINEVQIEIGGNNADNLSSNEDKDVIEGEDIDIVVFYENTFGNNSFQFDRDDVEISIYVDNSKIVADNGDSDVDGGEESSVSFSFDLDDEDVNETYDITVELFGNVSYSGTTGGLHGDDFKFKLNLKEEVPDPPATTDSDNDGVIDSLDLCPTTLSICDVDEAGCALDSDGDSICDGYDKYPDDPLNGEEDDTQDNSSSTVTTATDTADESPEDDSQGEKKEENKKSFNDTWSFVFGLIVGIVGIAVFFILTKV